MTQSNFEEVLDACVADILAGRRTVAECLEEWPQHRRRLAPLLETAAAMQGVPRTAETPVDPASRARFRAALRETPQQSPRALWRRPLRPLAGILAPFGFGAPWGELPAFGRVGAVAASAAALAVAAIALSLLLNRGATTVYASTLTVFAGGVEGESGGAWQPLADGAQLEEGARLRTDAEGSALLTFADGSTAGIEPGTELVIEFARIDGSRRIQLEQFTGRLWHDVAPDERTGSLYVVQTPDAVITARGTLFETAIEAGETAVSTTEGLVEIQAGEEQRFIAPGERARARAQRLVSEPREAREPGERLVLSIEAPFVASLMAPDGKAVGARPDGIVYRQIAGATTSNPGAGAQRIDLQRLQPGAYQLLLRRIGDGDGEIVLGVGPRELRFPVERAGDAVRVELNVSIEDGRLQVRPANVGVAEPGRVERAERVIVTERAQRRAVSIIEQRARRDRQAAERALSCHELAAFDADAAAACARVVAEARRECADGRAGAATTDCTLALTAAEDDCERLAETARHACKRELEALEDAAEREQEQEAPSRNLSPDRPACDEVRKRPSRPALSPPFPNCANEPDAEQRDETRPTTGASPASRDVTGPALRRSDAPRPVDIARARHALSGG